FLNFKKIKNQFLEPTMNMIYKLKCTFIILSFIFTKGISQINSSDIKTDSIIKANFNHKLMSRIVFGFNLFEGITSSYQFEKSLRNKFTYCLTTKISTPFLYSNSDLAGEQFLINFYPIIKNEFRFYTNLKKRLNKNKSIANFSGSYFGTNINIQFPKLIDNSLGLLPFILILKSCKLFKIK
ncbi:MAG: hypothetical protein ORN85_10745, partial [Sediminibacterium sp.]|nr:hypothetical protein [Sediminibacterium sp.]